MNNYLSQLLLLLLTCCLASAPSWSQSVESCIEFEGLPADSTFGAESGLSPGEVFYTENEVPISLDTFIYSNDNGTAFNNVQVWDQDDGFEFGSGQYLFVNNVNLSLEIPALSPPVIEVCFEFLDGGGDKNIAVNGEPILSIGGMLDISSLPVEIAPGVTASIELEGEIDLVPKGTICLTGPISSLIIGGQEFAIDNICLRTEDEPGPCEIDDLQIDAVSCNDDSTYSAVIDFEHSGTSESFFLETAGGFSGEFLYSDLPLQLDSLPFPADPNMVDADDFIMVCDTASQDCCARALVDIPCLPECQLGELQVDSVFCNDDSTYSAVINFRRRGTSEAFFLETAGGFSGEFLYSDLPLKLDSLPLPADSVNIDADDFIMVCDTASQDCCARAPVDIPCIIECELGEVDIAFVSCNDDSTYSAVINFRHRGTSGAFVLETAGGFSGEFLYSDLPLKLDSLPFPADSINIDADDFIMVCDTASQDCCTSTPVDIPCIPECEIGELQIRFVSCNDDSTYNAFLNFRHRGTSGAFFLETAGGFSGEFLYSDLPLQLDSLPFPADSVMIDVEDFIMVCDTASEGCCSRVSVDIPCIPECEITEPDITNISCNDDGTYNAVINFSHSSPSEYFVLKTAGGFREEFKYSSLPIQLEGLPIPEPFDLLSGEDVIEICDARIDGCCLRIPVDLPCLPDCEISDLAIVDAMCLGDSFYNVTINFTPPRTEGEFELKTAGGFSETYNYSQLPLRLTGLPVPDGLDNDFIKICDTELPDCCISGAVELPCLPRCEVGEVEIAFVSCNDDSTYSAVINFRHRNTSEAFVLETAGGFSGEFLYSDLPLKLDSLPFPADPNMVDADDLITVCDTASQDCCASAPVDIPCIPECEIGELDLAFVTCNDDSTYNAFLNFRHRGASGAFVLETAGGFSGEFLYSDLPLQLDSLPFPADSVMIDAEDLITVCDTASTDCCSHTPVDIPCLPECEIGELIVETHCNEDGTFNAVIDFDAGNTSGSFVLKIEGMDSVIHFSKEDLPLELTGLAIPTTDDQQIHIQVCDAQFPDCCASKSVPIDCPGQPCEIGDIKVETRCNDDGTLDAWIDFDADSTSGSFVLTVEEFGLEIPFPKEDLPLHFTGLDIPADVIEVHIRICDAQFPDCCASKTVLIDCPPDEECAISDIRIETECIDGRYFNAWVNFNAENTSGSFVLHIEENDFTLEFDKEDLPLGIVEIPVVEEVEEYHFKICDAQIPECCASKGVLVDCVPEGECEIGDIRAETRCNDDGTFDVWIDFDAGNTSGSFVLSFEEMDSVIHFTKEDLPLKLTGLNIPIITNVPIIHIQICDAQFPDCCASRPVEIDCAAGPCEIGDIKVETRCNDDGTFDAWIDFDADNTSGRFVLKIDESDYSLEFDKEDLPLELTGLAIPDNDPNDDYEPGDEDQEIHIRICDAEFPDCCASRSVILDCDDDGECEIGEPQVEITCRNNGKFDLHVDFEHRGGSNGFIVKINGRKIRRFTPYHPLPVIITNVRLLPEEIDEGEVEIEICDARYSDCCNRTTAEVDCHDDDCFIGEPVIEVECNGNGTFDAWLDFEYEGTSTYFSLSINGHYRGRRFKYSDLPLKFENLPVPDFDDHSDGIRFRICDVEFPHCCRTGYAYFDCPTEPECEIGEPRIEISCNDNGTFDAWVDFDHNNTSEHFVLKIIGAGFSRKFSYEDLPLELKDLPYRSTTNYPSDELEFRICDVESRYCCVRKTVDFDCPGSCGISMLRVAATRCDENGQYNIRLNFSHSRRRGLFILEVDGEMRGIYRYSDLPLELGPFDGPLEESQTFVVYDKENPECRARAVLMPFRCQPPHCEIQKVLVYDVSCHSDGTYDATLDLRHRGTGEHFILETAGGFRGEFSYDELPLRLEGLPAPSNDDGLLRQDVFEICDGEVEGCCARRVIHLPCVGLCQFLNLQAEATGCEDGQFFVHLSFEARETDSRGYFVFIAGRILGPFTYDETDLELGPFEADRRNPSYILLVDADNFICFNFTRVDPPHCEDEACRINEVWVESEDCNSDGSRTFSIDLDVDNAGNDFFEIFYRGERTGTYPLSNLPMRFDLTLHEEDSVEVRFEVCINDRPECCMEVATALGECNNEEDDSGVWPGDANKDNIANHLDLLNIGIAFDAQGPVRSNESTDWEEFIASDWNASFADGANYKNADTNGDGTVNADDTLAILLNYGRTHGEVRNVAPQPNTTFDPPIFIDLPEGGDLPGGVPFEVPIILGTAENPVKNIYGLAFRLEYDAELITEAEIVFPTTWFGAPGINSIPLAMTFQEEGIIEAALSRTDQNLVSGYGPVAYFRGIIDDIAGLQQTQTSIRQAMARAINDDWIPLNGLKQAIQITEPNADPGKIDLERGLRLYPNPTPGSIRIFNTRGLPVEWVDILDPQGRNLGSRIFEQTEVSLEHLPEGVYLLRMKIGEHVVTKRVVKM